MGSNSQSHRRGGKGRRSRVLLVALLILVAAIFAIAWLLFRDRFTEAAYRPVSPSSDLAGEWVEGESLDEVNRFRKRIAGKLRRSLFQRWNSTVVDGNWVYLNQELIGINAAPEVLEALVPVVTDYARDLEKLGIELVFCPLPPKWAVYPGPLLGEEPGSVASSTRLDLPQRHLLNRLQESDVTCIDLLPAFLQAKADGSPLLFPPDDSHLSPEGADLVARVLQEVLPVAPDSEGPFAASGQSEPVEVTRVGDLRRLLLQRGHSGLNEVPFSFSLQPVTGVWEAGDHTPGDVCLLGDSNLDPGLGYQQDGRELAVGIAPRLAFRRGAPVHSLWQGGDGATAPRRKFASRYQSAVEFRDHCRIVVWMVTARMLHQADRFEAVPPPSAGEETSPAKSEADWQTISVLIEELSDTPEDLVSLPYPHALQTVLVQRLGADDNQDGPAAILYREFMQDRKPIAADWRPGQRVDVSVRSWESLSEEKTVSRLMIFDSLPVDAGPGYYAIPQGEQGAFVPVSSTAEKPLPGLK